MKKLAYFIMGVLFTFTLTFMFVPALAANLETIEASLNSINLYLNKEKVASIGDNYTLSNGSVVPYSLIYKGTTFLPLREVGRLLGVDVNWEGNTRTVNIDTYSINEDAITFNTTTSEDEAVKSPSDNNSLIDYVFTAFDGQFTVNNMVGEKYFQTYYNGKMNLSEFCDWWNGLSQSYIKEQVSLIVKEINNNFSSSMPLNINFQIYDKSLSKTAGVIVLQIDENGEIYNCIIDQPPHMR